jgi:hypothetical protein
LQCRTRLTLFLVYKAHTTEISGGNKRAVTVSPLIFFYLVGRPMLMSYVTTARDIP